MNNLTLDLPFAGWQRSRRDDPETSKLAAERIGPRAGTHAAMILIALVERGPMNFSEIARAAGMKESQVWRRLPEMCRARYIELELDENDEPLLRMGGSRELQRVWRVMR